VPNPPTYAKTASVPPGGEQSRVPELIVRARELSDWQQIAELTRLPKVRLGTLRLPFTGKEQWRKTMETPPDGMTGIVAVLEGRIVGSADI
jgi:L-phenylalanine/L-methionine N-acetyltransferase